MAVHTDIDDEGQTVRIPEIGTTAADSDTAINVTKADEEVTIVDSVAYKNLVPNKEYKVVGTLMNKATGEPLLVDGKEVTVEKTFTPEKCDGTVEVAFTIHASELAGESIVVFETVYYNDIEVAVHADINDEGQTIHFPEIGTTALDSETEENVSKADEEVTIVDTVEYKNLVPGKEYKVTGVLMDKETGEPLLVGEKEVTAETTFTPEKANGRVELTFVFDGTALVGKTVVVFETMTYEGKEVAVHANIEDEAQTMHFPEIGTTAIDSDTEDKLAKADEEVTIIDTVEYKNLVPGKEYKLVGTLMDKATGEAVPGDKKEVTAETVFTPEEANGTVEVKFVFDGSVLKRKTVVVFESMYLNEKEVAVHADIEDEAQTVYFPEIGTTAKDADDGDQKALADEKITIVDTVAYKNLEVGRTYKVEGVLMDKSTGKELLIDGKRVTSEAEFVANEKDGTVDVIFEFNGKGLAGRAVVVFEKLYLVTEEEKILIAAHEDIEDEGQTVNMIEKTRPRGPKTGDDSDVKVWLVLGGMASLILGAKVLSMYKKKEENVEE